MDRGQLASLKRKLDHPSTTALGDLARELTACGRDVPHELLDRLAGRLQKGDFIDVDILADLVCSAHSNAFYLSVRNKLWAGGIWPLLKLLEAGFKDPEIERRLCDDLYKNHGPTDASRSYIGRALRDHGTTGCLETLEAISHETFGEYKTAHAVEQALTGTNVAEDQPAFTEEYLSARLDEVVRKGTIEFRELIQAAMEAVRTRDEPPFAECDLGLRDDENLFENSHEYARRAQASLPRDVGAALNHVRKSLESLLKAVIRKKGIEQNRDKPLDEYQLDELFKLINSEFRVPKYVRMHMTTMQLYSTAGSHDQGVPDGDIANDKAVLGLLNSRDVVERYFLTQLRSEPYSGRTPLPGSPGE